MGGALSTHFSPFFLASQMSSLVALWLLYGLKTCYPVTFLTCHMLENYPKFECNAMYACSRPLINCTLDIVLHKCLWHLCKPIYWNKIKSYKDQWQDGGNVGREGGSVKVVLKDIGSEGLWPQLVCCAPFPSIAQYFRILYLSYPKIWMAIVAYPKVQTTIVWYPDVGTSIVFLSEDKE